MARTNCLERPIHNRTILDVTDFPNGLVALQYYGMESVDLSERCGLDRGLFFGSRRKLHARRATEVPASPCFARHLGQIGPASPMTGSAPWDGDRMSKSLAILGKNLPS